MLDALYLPRQRNSCAANSGVCVKLPLLLSADHSTDELPAYNMRRGSYTSSPGPSYPPKPLTKPHLAKVRAPGGVCEHCRHQLV